MLRDSSNTSTFKMINWYLVILTITTIINDTSGCPASDWARHKTGKCLSKPQEQSDYCKGIQQNGYCDYNYLSALAVSQKTMARLIEQDLPILIDELILMYPKLSTAYHKNMEYLKQSRDIIIKESIDCLETTSAYQVSSYCGTCSTTWDKMSYKGASIISDKDCATLATKCYRLIDVINTGLSALNEKEINDIIYGHTTHMRRESLKHMKLHQYELIHTDKSRRCSFLMRTGGPSMLMTYIQHIAGKINQYIFLTDGESRMTMTLGDDTGFDFNTIDPTVIMFSDLPLNYHSNKTPLNLSLVF